MQLFLLFKLILNQLEKHLYLYASILYIFPDTCDFGTHRYSSIVLPSTNEYYFFLFKLIQTLKRFIQVYITQYIYNALH